MESIFDLHSNDPIKPKIGVQERLFTCVWNHSLYIEQTENIFEIYTYWGTFWLPFCVQKLHISGTYRVHPVLSEVKQFTWQIFTPCRSASWSEWQFWMFTVRAHIGRSPARSTPPQSSIDALLVFRRKDPCKARVKPKMSSNLADRPSLADVPLIWNCHLQQITDWVINVCSESPFESQTMDPPIWNCQLQQIPNWLIMYAVRAHLKQTDDSHW